MKRIDTANKATDLFGAGKHGYRPGNPATGQNPTECSPDAFNALQEEIATAIEGAGIALNPASNAQLLAAIQGLSQNLGDARYAKLAGLAAQLFSVAPATAVDHALALGQFTGNLLSSGYIKLPIWTGTVKEFLIVQWGFVTAPITVTPTIFPIAFPSACLAIFASPNQDNALLATVFNSTLTNFSCRAQSGTATQISWLAIGK